MAERKVHPDCANASNPYHECVEACLKKIAEGQTGKKLAKRNSGSFIFLLPRKLSMPKKKDLDRRHSNDSVLKNFNLSDNLSPKDLSFKKVESWDAELMFPKARSKVNQLQDTGDLHSPSEPMRKPSKQSNPAELDDDKVDSAAIVRAAECGRDAAFGSMASSITVVDHPSEVSDDVNEEDHEPVVSDSHVLGNYRVQESSSSVLKSVIDKYGDIAANCHLKSAAMRSYFLECVCSVIQELRGTEISQLSKSKIKEMQAIVRDVEAAGIDVGWLRNMLDEIAQVIQLNKQCREIEIVKRHRDADIGSARKELELELEDLAEKEKAVEAAKAKVAETRAQLSELEQESSKLHETMLSIKSKADSIDYKSLVAEIL
ncbi:uncharacterized protein LOC115735910 [Rhodamnia argentea]|uniref:Uncharacterized protein LOC115735910 n=1 Tax=Rhodamnia argentea TaxID=178133 RepID=A0A8B8NM42_9MYRT|nr:uncharacterized protein LOC115735910 [Rhodamnia argentea]XP_048128651.1 uncharacterized protein LOC115735910 [Rhodamnia argentea]XP_048128652.1 uncharacterized protein LOC115735910 [Rhodamnia argentea]